MATKFGVRPSAFFPELGAATAYLLDRFCFAAGAEREMQAHEEAQRKAEFEARRRSAARGRR